MMVSYRVFRTPQARLMLQSISDRRVRDMIVRRIDGLSKEPVKKGKALVAEFAGFRSLRVTRYRVLYKVDQERVIIVVVGIRRQGDTKDIYARVKKLLRLKLIELPADEQEEA